jgi:hypothetical protein
LTRVGQILLVAFLPAVGQTDVSPVAVVSGNQVAAKHTLQYGVEWRLVRAGMARVTWTPGESGYTADLHLESAGLVSKLYRVNDDYRASVDGNACARHVLFRAEEGKRRRETTIDFNAGKVQYVERDLVKNNIATQKELETPPCVYEYMGALMKLRSMRLEPGQSTQIPMTDGKKFSNVKVDAEERETVRIGAVTYNTMRYEIHMFNGVLIGRKARMNVWITEDARRLPVQLRVRMSVLVGTITLQLEKADLER